MSVTYGNILDQFNDITRDASRYHFTQAQVDRFAVRAVRELCERARYKDTAEQINVVAGTAEYSATADGYDVFRVEYNDEVLWPISRDKLRHAHRDYATLSGRPRFYYLTEIYDTQDALTVGLFEVPSSNLTNGLRMWYHGYPASPSGASALTRAVAVDIPEWAAGAMLFYMLYLAFTADTKLQSFEAAAVYKLLYEDILDRLVMRSRDRQPKRWTSGGPSSPTLNVLNRLPERITE